MGTPNRYPDVNRPDPKVPAQLREVLRPTAKSRSRRWFIVAAVVLALLVLVGIAIFIARLGGGGPAPARPKPQRPAMWMPAD